MTALFSTFINAVIKFFTSYFFKIRLFNKTCKLEASSKFRDAFSEEISRCKTPGDFKIKEILFKAMLNHQKAVTLFEPFVEKSNLDSFIRTWEKYCRLHDSPILNELVPEKGIEKEGYIQEITEAEQRELSLSFLNKLVSYASVK
jgi:hypothetical protein